MTASRGRLVLATIAACFVVGTASTAWAQEHEPPPEAPPELPPQPVPPVPPLAPTPGTPAVHPEGGFFPGEGFQLRSSDEKFKLRLRLQSAIRASLNVNGKAQFSNPFMTLRPIIEGNIYEKWIRYWTSLELAANPVYLLDSYVEVQPKPGLGFRIGQQWTPFSRHEAIYGPHQLLFPEWDPVANYFWTGRDKGITLFGSFLDEKIDYSLGGYLGLPLRQFQPIKGNYLVVGRIGVSPLGPVGTEFAYAESKDKAAPFKYALGINGASSKVTAGSENFNPSTFTFDVTPTESTSINHTGGFDVFVQSPRVMALLEGYVRRTDPSTAGPDYTSVGGFAQAGLLIYERLVDVSVRGSWVDVNIDEDKDNAFGIEGATNWYLGAPNVVLKFRYGYGSQRTPPNAIQAESGQSSGQAPLILAPGHVHIITAQINTSF